MKQAVTCGCLAADNFATPDPRPRIPYRYVSEFTLWALTASPLFLAADPRNMTALQRKVLLNGELIRINQDTPDNAGKFHSGGRVGFDPRCGKATTAGTGTGRDESTPCEIWSRRLSTGEVAVVLHNTDTVARRITATFASLGADASLAAPATVRDLWAHATLPGTHVSYSASVGPHEVVALLLSQK